MAILCLILCSLSQLWFFRNELMKLLFKGTGYFKELGNYVELGHTLLFFYFLYLKYSVMDKTLLPPDQGVGSHVILINSFVAFTAFGKVLLFLRAVPMMARVVMVITQIV